GLQHRSSLTISRALEGSVKARIDTEIERQSDDAIRIELLQHLVFCMTSLESVYTERWHYLPHGIEAVTRPRTLGDLVKGPRPDRRASCQRFNLVSCVGVDVIVIRDQLE